MYSRSSYHTTVRRLNLYTRRKKEAIFFVGDWQPRPASCTHRSFAIAVMSKVSHTLKSSKLSPSYAAQPTPAGRLRAVHYCLLLKIHPCFELASCFPFWVCSWSIHKSVAMRFGGMMRSGADRLNRLATLTSYKSMTVTRPTRPGKMLEAAMLEAAPSLSPFLPALPPTGLLPAVLASASLPLHW